MRYGVFACLLVACGSSSSNKAADGPVVDIDAPMQQAADANPLAWETVETISNDGQVIVERVSYRSGALKIYAHICRPADTARHKIAVYNHGGWYGLDVDPLEPKCTDTAKMGEIWIASSYRGEDGSDGNIEVCLGEVDDVLAMLPIIKAQPYSNPDHVFMFGGSHGGCITLRALERGAQVELAADLFGPTDLAAVDRFWRANPGTNQQFLSQLEASAGGTADAVPAAYDARSPIHFISDLPANIPLLVVHGTADATVPYDQSCALIAPLGLTAWHVDATGATVPTAPAGCEAATFQTGARPTGTWPGSRYFVAYDGMGHETTSAAAQLMLQDVATFALPKL